MSRRARELSNSGFYHIMFRGINHQNIFEEESDYNYLLDTVEKVKAEVRFKIQAYCLMTNHVHLLLQEKQMGEVSIIMKKVLTKYAMYFNHKYERSGALIGSRYKSKAIELDEYFISLLVYIHQNPVRAGLVARPEDYNYSSYHEYSERKRIVDTELALSLIGDEDWATLHKRTVEGHFSVSDRVKPTEMEIRQLIMKCTNGIEPNKIGLWDRNKRNAMLASLKQAGLSIREIERVTGISKGIIAKS